MRESHLRLELARLVDERRQLAAARQGDVDTAVAQAKNTLGIKIENLDKELSACAALNAKLRVDGEAGAREAKAVSALLIKSQKNLEDDRKNYESTIAKLEAKLNSTVTQREENIARVKECQNLNSDLRLKVEKLQNQVTMAYH